MNADSSLLIGGLLFVAVASGYFLAHFQLRRSSKERAATNGRPVSGSGIPGARQQESDMQASLELAELENDVLEDRFALGNVFRRRGETERAIRIHQSIINQADLPEADRDKALFALAEDYLRAGLLDRAESYFQETTSAESFKKASLSNLIGIYERQKGWRQAIETRRRLNQEKGQAQDALLAHYYCELAEESLIASELDEARHHLRQAQAVNPTSVRSTLLRAEIAESCNDLKLAQRLLVKVAVMRPPFARLAISRLVSLCRRTGNDAGSEPLLAKLVADFPDMKLPVAHAAILDLQMNDPVSLKCFEDYVRNDRMLGGMLGSTVGKRDDLVSDASNALDRIRRVLRRLALDGPGFGCVECGLTGSDLDWRCRGCLAWDSTLPTANLKFDSHLGSVGYIQ